VGKLRIFFQQTEEMYICLSKKQVEVFLAKGFKLIFSLLVG